MTQQTDTAPPTATPAESAADNMIAMDHVTMRFGTKLVLDELVLEAERGRVTVVMGGSGHGKSTILKLIMGFMRPTGGRIFIDGQNVLELPPEARQELQKMIGMSFQYSALFDSMTVFDNVAFPLREHTRLSEAEIADRVHAMLERMSLPGVEDRMPGDLSGGMKKRVGVARAIMMQPKIMLFDEPESGLDPVMATSIGDLIKEMRDSFGMTCLVISHNLHTTMHIADRICMLYKGKIIAQGTPQTLQEDPNPILQQFLHGRAEGPY